MRAVIEVKILESDPRTLYALEWLLTAVGVPFRFVEQWHAPALRVVCGSTSAGEECDLWMSAQGLTENDWRVRFADGLPLLYRGCAPAPEMFAKADRILVDLVGISFWLLVRREEQTYSNALGNDRRFEGYRSLLYDVGLLQWPVLDHYVARLRSIIDAKLRSRGEALLPIPPWPEGKQFAVILSHDVDRIQHTGWRECFLRVLRAFNRGLGPCERIFTLAGGVAQMGRALSGITSSDDPLWNFDLWADLEDQFGFRSTFFVMALDGLGAVNDGGYRLYDQVKFRGVRQPFRRVLRTLRRDGWEVGLHGSIDSHTDADMLTCQKARLEAALSEPVLGVRQHHLMFRIPDTWQAQSEAGFQYDSTCGFNKRVGFRAGTGLPFQPYDEKLEKPFPVIEAPLVIQDGAIMGEEPTNIDQASTRCIRILENIKDAGGLGCLLWHPHVAHERRYSGWFQVYCNLLQWIATQPAYVGPASEIVGHWIRRRQEVAL